MLGGEDEKLSLGTNQLDLELLAIKLSKEEEQFQLFEVRADKGCVFHLGFKALNFATAHISSVEGKQDVEQPFILPTLQGIQYISF